MRGTDLGLLIDAARNAGQLAMRHHGAALDVQYKDHDNSPVSSADLAVNALLEEQLRDARPDYGWLSEESADSDARQNHDHVFIIDPIDGTRSFVDGSKTWAHSLAVAHKGQITAAVVFLPMKDRLYSAARGTGAHLNDKRISVGTRRALDAADMLITKPAMKPDHWAKGIPQVTRHYRPSLAYRLALVAEGRFDAMVTFRPAWEWDIAAGALILSEAGASITDAAGAALRFNNPHPQLSGVVSANANLHAALLEQIGPR